MRKALRAEFLVIAALILVSGLVIYGWSAVSPEGTATTPAIQKAAAQPTPTPSRTGGRATITWERNGRDLRVDRAPRGANDVHLRWDRDTRTFIDAQWTRNGDPIGDPVRAPDGADEADVELRP